MEANLSPRPEDGRRKDDRRRLPREHSDRRTFHERRSGGFTRPLIGLLLLLQLARAAEIVVLLKSIKVLEPLAMFLTALLAIGAYATTMAWGIAVGFTLSLAVHEYGHFRATKSLGIAPKWWLFIPFLGALMPLPRVRKRTDEAVIAYGGPLYGGCFSLALFALWLLLPLPSPWEKALFTVSIASTLLNLFNMIPLSPIDGGRMTGLVHPSFRVIGFGLLLAFSMFLEQASILLVWMLVIAEVRLSPRTRLVIGSCLWFAMPVLILAGYHGKSVIEDWVYFVFGSLLVAQYWAAYRAPPFDDHDRRTETVTDADRRLWGVRYTRLLLALILLAGLHVPFLRSLAI